MRRPDTEWLYARELADLLHAEVHEPLLQSRRWA